MHFLPRQTYDLQVWCIRRVQPVMKPSIAQTWWLSVRTTADHFERGDLRNSVFTAKATAIGGVIGTVFGMCIKQRLASRLREAARSDADRIGPDSSPAARLAAGTDATPIVKG